MKIVITESQYKILEMNTSIKRRYNQIKDFLFNLMDGMYVCEYDNDEHFMEGVIYNAEDYFTDFNDFDGMDKEVFLGAIENELTDEIYDYYNRYCSEEPVNEDLGRWFKEKWVDVSRKVKGKHPPCGRKDANGKAYPKCRPSKKVSKETPKVASSYDKKEKKATTKDIKK